MPHVVLTDRDFNLLLSLYQHRYLTLGQLQRLYFPSPQTTARRVRLLVASNLVETLKPFGIADRVATLTPTGARTVAELLSVSVDDLAWAPRRRKASDYLFFKHFLAINDVWIALQSACQSDPVSLLGFLPEFHGRLNGREPSKPLTDTVPDPDRMGQLIRHTPDAAFALGKAGRAALFFLEIDRGTETISHHQRGVTKLLRFYLSYLLSNGYGRFQEFFPEAQAFRGFRVLFVTTSDQRLSNIRRQGGHYNFDSKAKRFVWLTTFTRLAERGILADIWRSLDPEDESLHAIHS